MVVYEVSLEKLIMWKLMRIAVLLAIWFAGLVATPVGVGFMIRGIWDEFSADGFVFLSLGLGLLTGCRVVMAVLGRRFAEG